MHILNKIIPGTFPSLKENFKQTFPLKKMDAVLGIGLWKAIDLQKTTWCWEIYQGKRYVKESD
jgi:hypothetical protein